MKELERAKEAEKDRLLLDEVHKPNLYKVACAVARMERSDEVVNALTLIIESGLNNTGYRNEDFGLLFGDIFIDTDGSNAR